MDLTHLKEIQELLKNKEVSSKGIPYSVPGLWFDHDLKRPGNRSSFNPCAYFLRQIESIIQSPQSPLIEGENGEWSRKAVIYNAHIRLLTAYDHNRNGQIDCPLNSNGLRETGTFLKTIALLPYLKRLGINTLHLLPITSIGEAHKKGSLGSPYATRNLFELDSNLSEPFLNLGAEKEFKALVEAAHHLGIRVVLEFVFRTASRDSDWVKEHPDWFYWIKEEIEDRPHVSQDESLYGSPLFDSDVLTRILDKVQKNDFLHSIAPSLQHRSMFTEAPCKDGIAKEGDRWVGTLPNGKRVKVAGAFSDWPPSDVQPPWEDVTYLKMYHHPEFNYIAYNTVRMYDVDLARESHRNEELWSAMEQVIPHYQKNYKIDGVMIDMGHALPPELLKKMVSSARDLNPDFAFWEENFHLTPKSKEQGYNAAIGYLWAVEHHPHKLKELFQRFEKEIFPVPFFGTSESHNTPRSSSRPGGILFSKFSWAINNFLPVVPFLHNGFELGEKVPVNTGLDFTPEEVNQHNASNLPLFSSAQLDWENADQFCSWMIKIAEIRNRYLGLIQNSRATSVKLLHFEEWGAFAFERRNALQSLVLVGNTNFEKNSWIKIFLNPSLATVEDLITDRKLSGNNGTFEFTLTPGEVLIFETL